MRFDVDPAPWDVKLELGEVHLWSVVLDSHVSDIQRLGRLLSADEQDRAEHFRFARDRHRFVVARGVLRLLLAAYTRHAPEALQFSYHPNGKPFLTDDAALAFNLAHSEAQALYAVCRNRKIGVDIERIRALDGYLDIARDHFAPSEYSQIASAPQQDRSELFFRYWTLKEAVVKASGMGIDRLRDFRLDVLEDGFANLEFFSVDQSSEAQWYLQWFYPAPDYAGALAATGFVERVVARACPDLDQLSSFLV